MFSAGLPLVQNDDDEAKVNMNVVCLFFMKDAHTLLIDD